MVHYLEFVETLVLLLAFLLGCYFFRGNLFSTCLMLFKIVSTC